MSLINDALKRASQTTPPPPPASHTPEAPLRPVEHKRPFAWAMVLVPLLVLVLALAGWFFVKGLQTQSAARLPGVEMPVSARGASAVAESLPTPPAPSDLNGAAGSNAPLATNVQATVEPPKPTFPTVRLQGIFYRPDRPSVVINAKSVCVGEKVAGAKVVAITRESATLEWNGETKVLTLE